MGTLTRFDFADAPVRGALVRLDSAWHAWAKRQVAAAQSPAILGEATAASVLLASHLKFRGRMNLQFQGGAGMPLLLSQIDHHLHVRSTWQLAESAPTDDWPSLVAGGQLAVMLEPESGLDRYQALVDAGGASLAADLEGYFAQSEQLATRIWLSADADVAAGLLLQQLPDADADAAATLADLAMLADTADAAELRTKPADTLLRHLFALAGLRVHDTREVELACRCSRERIGALILSLGREEISELVAEQGQVEATCEFCGQVHRYAGDDALALFDAEAAEPPTASRH